MPMIVPFVVCFSAIDDRHGDTECKMHNLVNSIYSELAEEEKHFLTPIPPACVTYHLVEKYGTKYANDIYDVVDDSYVSKIRNECKIQLYNDSTIRNVIVFTHVALLVKHLNTDEETIVRFIDSFQRLYQSDKTRPTLNINVQVANDKFDTDIIKELDTAATEILSTLSEKEEEFLSEAPDVVIMFWLFTTRWVFLNDGYESDDYEYVSKIENEEFIDEKMLRYLTKKYNLLIVHVDEFRFQLASAYVTGKIKNKGKTIDDCIQLFEMIYNLFKPRPSEKSGDTTPESQADDETDENEAGESND